MVNLSLEVINLIVLVHELKIMLVHLLLTVLQFLLQLCDLLGLHTLELLKLTSLSSGGLLCLPDKATVPKQLLVALGRVVVDSQELLVLVAEATLQVSHLLAHGTMLLGHTTDLLVKGLDLLGIATKTAPLSCNDAFGVMLQLE
jgi:hypothetical protein